MITYKAIEKLEDLNNCYNNLSDEDKEAIDMAIDALAKIDVIKEIIDMPFEWEQDDRRRYAIIVDTMRKNLTQEEEL